MEKASENMEILPEELQTLLNSPEKVIVLDVRETWELEKASFNLCLNIPLNHLPNRLHEIPEDCFVVTICHHGMRSMRAACYLKSQGKNVRSLKGGIDYYARCIDPRIPVY